MKLLSLTIPLLLLASIIYAAPESPPDTKVTPPVTTEVPPVNKDEVPPKTNKPSLPVITNFDPKIDVASPVGKDELCSTRHSPAKKQVVLAFKAFHTARTYMLGAIINKNPTHDELQEAAKWQLGQTEEIAKVARDLNKRDSGLRRGWYSSRLRWLKFKIMVARKLLKKGLPSWPWLEKHVTRFRAKRTKWKARIEKLKNKVRGIFGRKKKGEQGDDKKDDKEAPSTQPTTEPTTTPTTTPAPLGEEDADDLEIEVPKNEAPISKEELKKEIDQGIPAKDARDAAAEVAANNSPMAANNPNFPSIALIQASGQVVDEEVLKKLGLSIQEENAKVEVILEEIDTTKLC